MPALTHAFKRDLGFWQLTAIAFGGIIGSGWLLGAMTAATTAGPASLITWVVGGVALLVIALVMVELGGSRPMSGGLVRWPFLSSGRLVATLAGWGVWIAYATNPPSEAAAMLQYSNEHVSGLYNTSDKELTTLGLAVAVALMVLFIVVNWFGVLLFARVNLAVTIAKFVVPTATVILFAAAGFNGSNYTDHGGFAPYGYAAPLSAIATAGIVYAYTGFQGPLDLSGEARNARRDVPRAVITALVLSILLYTALEVVFLGTVHVGSGGWSGINLSSPYAQIAVTLNLAWFSWVLYADSILSPGGSALVFTAETSREVYSLSRNRFLPEWFAHVDGRSGIPRRALLANFAVGLVFLLTLHSWQKIIAATSILGLFAYSISAVSVAGFARAEPQREAGWVRGSTYLAPIGFVLATLIFYWSGWDELKIAVPVLLAALLVYVLDAVRHELDVPDVLRGAWLLVYLGALLLISYFGAKAFGGDNAIPGPWDSVVVAAVGAAAYVAGVRSSVSHLRHHPSTESEPELQEAAAAAEPGSAALG
jgi:amino acid transporter